MENIRGKVRAGEDGVNMINSRYIPEGWAESVKEKLIKKMRFGAEMALEQNLIPYTTKDGKWARNSIDNWTNGFWGAEMWQMYLMTKDSFYRDAAVKAEEMMDEALRDFKGLHHDVGFMWLIQSGVRYSIEGNRDSQDRALFCANMLAGRFNPNGFIRAWNGDGKEGWAIVDCMMNLSLLYWASRQTKDPRFKLIAMRHADTNIRYVVREDGSCNHILCFDPETGEPLENPAGQGHHSGSSWSRGQAWGLYGFVLSYLNTGKAEYLTTAKRIANYFISQIQDEWIPLCDFRAPAEPKVYDDAACGIAICGLMELAKCVDEWESQNYMDAACRMLVAMEARDANWEENNPAILTRCTVQYRYPEGWHMTMNYADYFFIEAVQKLLGEKKLFWRPDQT